MTKTANELLSLVQVVDALPVNAPDAWLRSRRERYAYIGVRNAMVRLASHGTGVAVVARLGECVDHLADHRITVPNSYSLLALYETSGDVHALRVAVLRLCAELSGQGEDDVEVRAAITSDRPLQTSVGPNAKGKVVKSEAVAATAIERHAEVMPTAPSAPSTEAASVSVNVPVNVPVNVDIDDEWEFDDLEEQVGAPASVAAVPVAGAGGGDGTGTMAADVTRPGDQIIAEGGAVGRAGGNSRRGVEIIADENDRSGCERLPAVGDGVPEIILNPDFRERVARFKAMIAEQKG